MFLVERPGSFAVVYDLVITGNCFESRWKNNLVDVMPQRGKRGCGCGDSLVNIWVGHTPIRRSTKADLQPPIGRSVPS